MAIQKSLGVGVNHSQFSFVVMFLFFVNLVKCSQFSDTYFRSSNFVQYNKCNEGVCVVFPIYMHSYVKCIRCDSNIIDYCETVYANIIKKR